MKVLWMLMSAFVWGVHATREFPIVNRTWDQQPIETTSTISNNQCAVSSTDPMDPKQLSMDCPSSTIRFIGIGDWGEKTSHPGLLSVRDGILSEVENMNIDFILSVGDNFYDTGVHSISDPQWNNTWIDRFSIGSTIIVPWFSVLGNHDHYGNSKVQIEYSTISKYWILPSESYSIYINNKLKLVMLDTFSISESDFIWITNELNDPNASFILTVGHYQIYSAGTRGDTRDVQVVQLNKLIQESELTKAYICGHEHDMQYLTLGEKDYFSIGGGGRKIDDPSKVSPGTKANVQYYTRNYGFAVFEVNVETKVMIITYHIYNSNGTKLGTRVFTKTY